MATVYSSQLFAYQGWTSGTVPNGNIPLAGTTLVIRSISAYTGTLPVGPLAVIDLYSGAEIIRLSPPLLPLGGY